MIRLFSVKVARLSTVTMRLGPSQRTTNYSYRINLCSLAMGKNSSSSYSDALNAELNVDSEAGRF